MKILGIYGIRHENKNYLFLKLETHWVVFSINDFARFLYLNGSHGLTNEYLSEVRKKVKK